MDSSSPDLVIASAVVDPSTGGLLGAAAPGVTVTYVDGTTERIFTFYPDEIQFSAEEFVGLTRAQAMWLRHDRDVAYLRAPDTRKESL